MSVNMVIDFLNLLDLRTLFYVTIILRFAQCGILFLLWRTQKQYPPAKHWAIGSALLAMGLLVIDMRGVISLDLSVLVGNPLLFVGMVFFFFGIYEAAEGTAPWRLGAILAVVSTIGIWWYYLVQPNQSVRIIVHGISTLTFSGITVYACLKYKEQSRKLTFRLIAAVITLIALATIWRSVGAFTSNVPTIFTQNIALTHHASVFIFYMFAITCLLILLTAQKLQAEIEAQAQKDYLTGAYNRRAFNEMTDIEWRRSCRNNTPVSLMMLDLDRFKAINDTYGHSVGDAVLAEVSKVAQTVLRAGDIWARYGGEEFVILLRDADAQEAAAAAERLCRCLREAPVATSAGLLNITVSIGVASRTPASATWTHVLNAADAALYQAKISGRNRVVASDGTMMAS